MRKYELIQALQPFDDEIEIVLSVGYNWASVIGPKYGLRKDGEGVFVLVAGSRVEPPVKKLTSELSS